MTRNLAEMVPGTIEIARADLIPAHGCIISRVSVNSGVASRSSLGSSIRINAASNIFREF